MSAADFKPTAAPVRQGDETVAVLAPVRDSLHDVVAMVVFTAQNPAVKPGPFGN